MDIKKVNLVVLNYYPFLSQIRCKNKIPTPVVRTFSGFCYSFHVQVVANENETSVDVLCLRAGAIKNIIKLYNKSYFR